MKPFQTKILFAALTMSFLVPVMSQAQTQVELPPGTDMPALLAPPPVKPVIVSCTCSYVEQGIEIGETSKFESNLFGGRNVVAKVERRFDIYTIDMVTRDAKGFGQIKFGRYQSKYECDSHLSYNMPACPKDR